MSNQWEKNIYIKEVYISASGNFLVDSQLEVDNQINISFVRRSSLFNVQSLSKKNQNQNVKRETKPNFPQGKNKKKENFKFRIR